MTPYIASARDYFAAGWSPIPLPVREKRPVPDDFTGAAGKYVVEAQLSAWLRGTRARAGNLSYPPGNVALRLPRYVLGIDVDRYSGKAGAATMKKAVKEWGPLPATWISTSRTDGSGIALYRIPEGLAWPGQVGPGVETLRWDHRFAVVAPSVHDKTGQTYHWIRPDGTRVDDEIPTPQELPELPAAWVEGLTSGKKWAERATSELSDQEVRDWLAQRKEEKCSVMAATTARSLSAIRTAGDDGGAHEVARDSAWAVIGDASAGHGGVVDSLAKLRRAFLSNVRARRAKGEAESEWARIVIRGVQKVAAEGAPEDEDMCDLLGNGGGSSSGTSGSRTRSSSGGRSGGSSAFDFVRDDIGNAQRLARHLGSDAKYVPGLGVWALYDPSSSLWSFDIADTRIRQEASAVVRAMEAEAAYIEDPKAAATFLAFVRSSGNVGRLKAMIELARSLRGMSADAEAFDAAPELLATRNGMVILGDSGVDFRAIGHADMATYATRAEYIPRAKEGLWAKFVKRVLPDEDIRRWVQTLVGYSLYGANPERVLVIAKGPTTAGKGTFADVLMAALGPYSSPFNLSLFREKIGEGPRPDILSVISRRLIVASEASAEWALHADAIKRNTGGEAITARLLNSSVYVTRVPAFTPWLVTNAFPTVPGADKAVWRRIKAAPFLVELDSAEVDTMLRERMLRDPGCLAEALSWAVAGWDLYCADGLREVPPAAGAIEMEARTEMSELDMWLSEACDMEAGEATETGVLYDSYRMWMTMNADERHTLSLTAFGRALGARGHEKVKRRVGERAAWTRSGLRLRTG